MTKKLRVGDRVTLRGQPGPTVSNRDRRMTIESQEAIDHLLAVKTGDLGTAQSCYRKRWFVWAAAFPQVTTGHVSRAVTQDRAEK